MNDFHSICGLGRLGDGSQRYEIPPGSFEIRVVPNKGGSYRTALFCWVGASAYGLAIEAVVAEIELISLSL